TRRTKETTKEESSRCLLIGTEFARPARRGQSGKKLTSRPEAPFAIPAQSRSRSGKIRGRSDGFRPPYLHRPRPADHRPQPETAARPPPKAFPKPRAFAHSNPSSVVCATRSCSH